MSAAGTDDRDPLASFPDFAEAVRARLEAGRATYGDRSFARDPADLLGELAQEALDLAGWGFVLFERIRSQREALQPAQPDRHLRPASVDAGAPAANVSTAANTATKLLPTAAPAAPAVRVVVSPIFMGRDPRAGAPLTLARVPALHELVRIPEGAVSAGDYKVVGVRHTAAAVDAQAADGVRTAGSGDGGHSASAAEVFLQPARTVAEAQRAVQAADRAAKAGK